MVRKYPGYQEDTNIYLLLYSKEDHTAHSSAATVRPLRYSPKQDCKGWLCSDIKMYTSETCWPPYLTICLTPYPRKVQTSELIIFPATGTLIFLLLPISRSYEYIGHGYCRMFKNFYNHLIILNKSYSFASPILNLIF